MDMKTAIQDLIEHLEKRMKSYMSFDMALSASAIAITLIEAKKLLEKEKEQIIDAYIKGFDISAEGWNGEYGIKDFNNIKEEISAEEYYNKTYNSNK